MADRGAKASSRLFSDSRQSTCKTRSQFRDQACVRPTTGRITWQKPTSRSESGKNLKRLFACSTELNIEPRSRPRSLSSTKRANSVLSCASRVPRIQPRCFQDVKTSGLSRATRGQPGPAESNYTICVGSGRSDQRNGSPDLIRLSSFSTSETLYAEAESSALVQQHRRTNSKRSMEGCRPVAPNGNRPTPFEPTQRRIT